MAGDRRYEIILFWSDEDQAIIAEVPELAGCAADGNTYEEAVANAEIAIEEWIATATSLAREIPTPKGRLRFFRGAHRRVGAASNSCASDGKTHAPHREHSQSASAPRSSRSRRAPLPVAPLYLVR
jgi:predicted RNase H-like HicB family nuclease